MRVKLNKGVRPEFRRLIKDFRTFVNLSCWLGVGEKHLAQMKYRGYLPVKYAKLAEEKSNGKYNAKNLAMKGQIK